MFRHDPTESHRKMFDTALSALCADVVFPMGKQPGGCYPPLRGLCHRITERKFRGVRRGGYYPPANVTNFWAEPYWPGNVTMSQNIPCFDIVPPNFICKCSILHCRRFAPTLFSHGENNRADAIRPYADVPHCTWCVFFGWPKLINYRIDCVHCQSVWFMEHFIACCFIFPLTGQTHLVTIEL